jgi:hypothetical protein
LAAPNYTFATGSTASFTINKAVLSVDAVANSKTYGSSDPGLTATFSGFQFSDNAGNSSITGSASCTRAAGETVAGSPYTITCTPNSLAAPNYTFATGSTASFTINKAVLSVNAVASSKTYGASDPSFTNTFSGFQFSDNAGNSSITGSAACTRAAGETVPGSPYAITCAPGTLSAPNYTFATGTTANFTIGKAVLTVTPDNKTRAYGAADPAFTYQFSGFQFTDDSTAVSGTASCVSTATASSSVAGSPYAITCTLGSLAADNYSFNFTGGQLTITQAQLLVNAVANSKVYGAADPTFAHTLSGFVNGEDATSAGVTGAASCARTSGESVAASPYTITCTPGTLTAANYSFATGSTASFTISQAQLLVNAVANSKVYGAADPTFAHTLSGFVNGEDATSAGVTGAASCARTSGESVAGSPYTITCTPGTLTAANYSFATGSTASFTISKANPDCSSITAYAVTYDTNAHTATGTCQGVGTDGTLAGLDLSATTHTAAGDYPGDPWTFTDVSGNYNDTSGTVDDSIAKANADCSSITGYSVT